MRRTFARTGLAAMLAGPPALLLALGFDPRWPKFSGTLSDTYLPLDEVLQVLALVIWVLWAYLLIATLLRAGAVLLARRGAHESLLGVTSLLVPGPLRRLVDFAVGGALVAASLSVNSAAPSAAATRPAVVALETTPPGAAIPAMTPVAARHYEVRPGDSLWRIAERELGSGYEWRRIFDLNRGKTFSDGRRLTNPRLIHPGWTLELPRRDANSPRLVSTPTNDPTRNGHRKAATVASPSKSPPQVRPATPSESADEVPQGIDEEAPTSRPEPVMRIPSGALVAASFASGLLTAELLGRLRRRRRWRFTSADDSDAQAIVEDPPLVRDLRHAGGTPNSNRSDVAIEAVSHAWQASTGTWPRVQLAVEERERVTVFIEDPRDKSLPEASGGSVGPSVRFTREGATVRADVGGPFPARLRRASTALELALTAPIGQTRDGAAVHVAALGTGGIAASGAHAADLVRQFMVALAAPSSPQELHIVLLGPETLGIESLPQVRGSYGWSEAEQALRDLQQEFVARARIFLDEAATDVWSHLGARPVGRLPALVVVASEPPAALKRLVEALGQQASSLGGALVTLGWIPDGCRFSVRADDSFEVEMDMPCPKLVQPFLLDTEATAQAVDVIQRAWPKEDSVLEPPSEDTSEPTVEVPATRDEHPPAVRDIAQPVIEQEPNDPNDAVESARESSDTTSTQPPQSLDVPTVRCLGSFEVSRGKRTLGKGWRKKSKEILAYLIAHPAGAPKDRIVDALWPESPGPDGEAAFLRRVSELRQYVRGHQDSRAYVERNGETYRLEPQAWAIDALDMERLLAESARCPDPDRAEAMLREAVTLYRGEFCADCYYSWLEPVRERYRVLHLRGLALLADLLEGRGEHEEALSLVDQAIAIDPLSEDLWRRAMTIEAARGRRAVALRRYHRLEDILEKEIDVDPDPETQALAKQIQAAH